MKKYLKNGVGAIFIIILAFFILIGHGIEQLSHWLIKLEEKLLVEE